MRCGPSKRAVLVALCAGMIACADKDLTRPRGSVRLLVTYEAPAIDSLLPPPPESLACLHHSAPAQLTVQTSWGETGRFASAGSTLMLGPVPTGRTYWIRVFDIAWCAIDPFAAVATQGVRVNGVELDTLTTVEEQPALTFSVGANGRVQP